MEEIRTVYCLTACQDLIVDQGLCKCVNQINKIGKMLEGLSCEISNKNTKTGI